MISRLLLLKVEIWYLPPAATRNTTFNGLCQIHVVQEWRLPRDQQTFIEQMNDIREICDRLDKLPHRVC